MPFGRELFLALRPYPPTERYLIGVSGGRDSVALLHGLFAIGYRQLVVCHLDHGMRGKEAQRDTQFVRQLAVTMGLPVEVGHTDVPALAKREKSSLEAMAREARYQFFADVADKLCCHKLFLAHHADDQVETFLFNLLRGAGKAGLGAMVKDSERAIGAGKLQIIRPLLSVWRTEIDEYLRAEGFEWREDATNEDAALSIRNCLRNEILPLLAKAMKREVKSTLWRTADILGTEEAWLDSQLAAEGSLPERLSVARLTEQPTAKQRRMIRSWLLDAKVPRIGYKEVERVRSLLDKTNGLAKVNLPDSWHARRRAGILFLEQTGDRRESLKHGPER